MADEKQSLQSAGKQTRRTKQREKHRWSTRKPTVGNAAIPPEISTSTQSLDTTTASESHPESHRQPPPPRKRTLAHTPPIFGDRDTEHGAPVLGLPGHPRCLSRTSPQSSTGASPAIGQPAAAPEGPGAALPALPWPAAALSPRPGGEAASMGGTANALPCFGRPCCQSAVQPQGSPGAGGGAVARAFLPAVQAARQLGAASRPPPDRTHRMFKAPSD